MPSMCGGRRSLDVAGIAPQHAIELVVGRSPPARDPKGATPSDPLAAPDPVGCLGGAHCRLYDRELVANLLADPVPLGWRDTPF